MTSGYKLLTDVRNRKSSQSWWRPEIGSRQVNKYVSRDWPLSTHAAHALDERSARGPRQRGPRASAGQMASARASARGPHASRFVRFWASGWTKFTKMGDSLAWTPMNHRAKFDAASFILGRKIRNRTNKKQTNKQKHTNSKRYIHPLPIGMCG